MVGQAIEGWRLGKMLCQHCSGYHRFRPVLRAIGAVKGARQDFECFPDLWTEHLQPGARVLIAGAADPGQLLLVAERTKARPLDVLVADRCPAPLALMERLSLIDGVAVTTRVADLVSIDTVDAYDLVISHKMLPFVPRADRLKLLQGFRRSLRPGGRLLISIPIVQSSTAQERETFETERYARMRGTLEANEMVTAFFGDSIEEILALWSTSVRQRTAAFTDRTEVLDLIVRAGFEVEEQRRGGDEWASFTGFDRRGITVLARG
jgi:SAM-dependent methyltransferase